MHFGILRKSKFCKSGVVSGVASFHMLAAFRFLYYLNEL